jgi:hypothetical protein
MPCCGAHEACCHAHIVEIPAQTIGQSPKLIVFDSCRFSQAGVPG